MARKPPKSEIDKQLDALGIDEVRKLYGRVRTKARREAIHDYIVRYEEAEKAAAEKKTKPSPAVDTDKPNRVKEANALAEKVEAENDKIRAKTQPANTPKQPTTKSDKDK